MKVATIAKVTNIEIKILMDMIVDNTTTGYLDKTLDSIKMIRDKVQLLTKMVAVIPSTTVNSSITNPDTPKPSADIEPII